MTRFSPLIALIAIQIYRLARSAVIQAPKIDIGSDRILANRTVYGSVILSDRKSISASLFQKNEQHLQISNHSELLIEEVLGRRTKNVQDLVNKAPFELQKWPTINTRPCPHYLHSGHNRVERGQGMAHMQIWLEFVYFDPDVLDARVRRTPEYITSNSYSSVSGIFTAVQNGSLYKNRIPFLDDDIMLIFEDSVELLPNTSLPTIEGDEWTSGLRNALNSATSDVISLGHQHCVSNHTKHIVHHHGTAQAHAEGHVPAGHSAAAQTRTEQVSAYAYAITRAGARKLIRCYDLCGRLIEEQFKHCIDSGLVSHSVIKAPMFTCQP